MEPNSVGGDAGEVLDLLQQAGVLHDRRTLDQLERLVDVGDRLTAQLAVARAAQAERESPDPT